MKRSGKIRKRKLQKKSETIEKINFMSAESESSFEELRDWYLIPLHTVIIIMNPIVNSVAKWENQTFSMGKN